MPELTAEQRKVQIKLISEWLAVFIGPDQVTEVRALNFADRKAVSQFFTGKQLDQMAQAAVEFELQGARGVYFTPNPLNPELLQSRTAAKDTDVLRRRWLLVDVDAAKESGQASTDAEKNAAWQVLVRCQETIHSYGMANWRVADSGNGYHLYIPVDLPNDQGVKEWHRALLKGLQARCGDDKAVIDPTTYNAARIMRIPGTLTRKGHNTPDRPFRWGQLLPLVHTNGKTA